MLLIDSDVMIDLLRRFPPAVAWLDSVTDEEIVLPGLVAMELLQGCQSKTELRRLQKELETYAVIWPAPEVCDAALEVFARYHLSHRLGMMDALIGQLAVALELPLHTFNQKHYAMLPGLKTAQPYLQRLIHPS